MERTAGLALLEEAFPGWSSGKRIGPDFKVRCPFHEDSIASLRINESKLTWYCDPCAQGGGVVELAREVLGEEKTRAILRAKPPVDRASGATGQWERIAVYEYHDAKGNVLSRKVRLECDGKKYMPWEIPFGANGRVSWRNAKDGEGNPHVLYRQTDVLNSEGVVHVCEGEKAVDRIREAGGVATCSPTTSWDGIDVEPLRGRDVWIWADRDESGIKQAAAAQDAIAPVAQPIRMVQSKTANDHDDAFDHLEAGYPLEDADPMKTPSSVSMKGSSSAPSSEHLTDLGNARRLVSHHGTDLRYCHVSKRWLVWDGRAWVADTTGEVMRRAKAAVGAIYTEAAKAIDVGTRREISAHARKSENERQLKAMISLAASEPDIPVCPDDLDQDFMILNAENGTIDLCTGELRPHRREDLLTKIISVNYDPSVRSELFESFLERIIPDASVRDFLQRAVGYSLTGLTVEQVLFLLWGTGANGKTTFIETVIGLLGDYSLKTPADTLLARRDTGIPNDVAALRGARLVAAVEMEEGRRLAEVRVKELTGGDTIAARFMRGEWFTFRPACKVWLVSNHRPVVRGTDHAIWRRLRLIPFTETITDSERNPHLIEKLKGELAGVLTWAVEGCLAWQREGLKAPDSVLIATQEYRQEQDLLGEFFRDRCVLAEGAWASAADLYRAYCDWDEGGRAVMSKRQLGLRLRERGFDDVRKGKSRARAWLGVGLVDSQHGDAAGDDVGDGDDGDGDDVAG